MNADSHEWPDARKLDLGGHEPDAVGRVELKRSGRAVSEVDRSSEGVARVVGVMQQPRNTLLVWWWRCLLEQSQVRGQAVEQVAPRAGALGHVPDRDDHLLVGTEASTGANGVDQSQLP